MWGYMRFFLQYHLSVAVGPWDSLWGIMVRYIDLNILEHKNMPVII